MHCDFVPVLGLLILLAPDLLGHLHLEPGLGDGLGPSQPQSRHDHIHQQEIPHVRRFVVSMALMAGVTF